MKAVYITAGFAIVALGTWLAVILVNGVRKRIATVNRRREERKRNGNH